MGDCSLNRCEGDDLASFSCNECGNVYCSTHRLPEKHQCSALISKDSEGKRFETGLADKKDRSSVRKNEQTSNRDIRPEPVEPETVGTRKQPDYSSSPATELKDRSKTSSSTEYRGLIKSILPFVIILAIVLIGGGIVMGQISAEEYLGPPGKQIDEALRSVGPIGIFNESNQTQASTPEITQNPAETETGTSEPEQSETPISLPRSRLERLIHIESNERRSQHGLSSLDRDAGLREIARQHSAVMAEHNDIFHTQPDDDTWEDRYDVAGYNCRVQVDSNEYATGGENVAKTWYQAQISSGRGEFYFDSPQELANGIVDQWMNSTGHRENILRPYWNNEGIGVVVSEEEGNTAVFVTQNFC